jgi:DsbC/DsbD-like thiol-disulfide interchange protein
MIRTIAFLFSVTLAAGAAEWSPAVEVRQEDTLCLTYQARLDGAWLAVRAAIEPGWHTFAMDNKVRAEEKLAGRKAISMDQPTQISVSGGLETAGSWLQTPPKDFSRPELRWFSWGFERQALFAAKVRRGKAGPVQIAIRGQACTETTCKNIDVSFQIPAVAVNPAGDPVEIHLKDLIPVK